MSTIQSSQTKQVEEQAIQATEELQKLTLQRSVSFESNVSASTSPRPFLARVNSNSSIGSNRSSFSPRALSYSPSFREDAEKMRNSPEQSPLHVPSANLPITALEAVETKLNQLNQYNKVNSPEELQQELNKLKISSRTNQTIDGADISSFIKSVGIHLFSNGMKVKGRLKNAIESIGGKQGVNVLNATMRGEQPPRQLRDLSLVSSLTL